MVRRFGERGYVGREGLLAHGLLNFVLIPLLVGKRPPGSLLNAERVH